MFTNLQSDLIPHTPSDNPTGPYLIFAPHQDDETLGMGGTIALATQNSIPVYVIFITDGGKGGDPLLRKKETNCAAELLGFSIVEFWDLPDGELFSIPSLDHNLQNQLGTILQLYQPKTVFLPSLQEFHPDHRATTRLIWPVLKKLGYTEKLWTYEITRQSEANRLIDISKVIELKKQAISCYMSQLAQIDYKSVAIGLNTARSLTLSNTDFAEAFYEHQNWHNLEPNVSSLKAIQSYLETEKMDYEQPLVSVIVRTKDRRELLREALLSIEKQKLESIEVVVVNDAGQDVSDLLEDFKEKFTHIEYVFHPENLGRPAAANSGLKKANGEWICFLDDDDLYHLNAIRNLLQTAEIEEAAVVYGQVETKRYKDDGAVEPSVPNFLFAQPFDPELLLCCNYIPLNAVLFHRSVFEQIGLFDESLPLFEDWDFFLRASYKFHFKYVPELVAEYRDFGQATISGLRFQPYKINDIQNLIWSRHWDKITFEAIRKYTDYLVKLQSYALERQISNLKERLEQKDQELTELKAELKETLAVQEERLRDKDKQIQALNDITRQMENTLSWRITAPLRFIRSKQRNFSWRQTLKDTARGLPLPESARNWLRAFYYKFLAAKPKSIEDISQNKTPLISVVVPIYNHSRFLQKCINSVLAQTYKNLELILVDDASSEPEVRNILSAVQDNPRCKVILNSENKGISETQNLGVLAAQGSYIAFIDCDDYLQQSALETVVSMLRAETMYAFSDRIYVNTEDKEVSRVSFIELPQKDYLQEQLDGKMYTSHLKVVHHKVFEKIGLFDSRFDAAQDYEFLMRVAFHFPSSTFLHVPYFIYYHRWHEDQQTIKGKERQEKAVQLASDLVKKKIAIREGKWDKLLSFLVLSFGKEDQTLQCIQSIKETVKIPHEIIVWDNGSRPQAIEFLEKNVAPIQGVRIFYSKENLGPALGRIRALQYAQGDYIISADNDLEFCPGWLEEMIVRAEEDEEIAAVCCRVGFPNGTIQFTGGWTEQNGIRLKLELYDQGKSMDDLSTMRIRDCDWVPIGATLYKGDFPLDPGYPNVFEDIAVSTTLKKKGKRLVNSPASLAIHHHIMFDSKRSKKEKDYLSYRYDPQTMLKCVKRYYEQHGLIIEDDFVFSVNNLKGKSNAEILKALENLE